MRVVSVMQPYFAPYAGYWRLLAGADVFVLYDCVQFPRRGWVHRNRLPDASGELQWLTLPLKPAAFDARIDTLEFADDAAARIEDRIRPFPSLKAPAEPARRYLHAGPFAGLFVDYLERQIDAARQILGFDCRLVRSSSLGIDPALRGQDRILAIVEAVGGTDYLNASGGRELYDAQAFAARDLALHFLEDHVGTFASLLQRLAVEDPAAIREEILAQTPRLRRT